MSSNRALALTGVCLSIPAPRLADMCLTINQLFTEVKIDKDAVKVPVSIRLEGSVLVATKAEAERLGVPYQTLIGSIPSSVRGE